MEKKYTITLRLTDMQYNLVLFADGQNGLKVKSSAHSSRTVRYVNGFHKSTSTSSDS